MLCCIEGRVPMSRRKLANPFWPSHRSQTVMPRPPYSFQSELFALKHLSIMPCQFLNSRLSVLPWVRCRAAQYSRLMQPQLLYPDRRVPVGTCLVWPQSHLQNQRLALPLFPRYPSTRTRPNLLFRRSRNFGLLGIETKTGVESLSMTRASMKDLGCERAGWRLRATRLDLLYDSSSNVTRHGCRISNILGDPNLAEAVVATGTLNLVSGTPDA